MIAFFCVLANYPFRIDITTLQYRDATLPDANATRQGNGGRGRTRGEESICYHMHCANFLFIDENSDLFYNFGIVHTRLDLVIFFFLCTYNSQNLGIF